MTKDYNPLTVPIKKAATIILLADGPDLRILMMQRNQKTIFGGGMWVFPGGGLDASDQSAAIHARSIHQSDRCASKLLGLPRGGLSYYSAAIREAFEEAGILLALDQTTQEQLDLSNPLIESRLMVHRDALNNQEQTLDELLRKENLILATHQMHYVARWITPSGPPRRFDARFFVARVPTGQSAVHDNNELIHSQWILPKEILERHAKGEMEMMEPTLRMVKNLCLFSCADEVMTSAAAVDMPYHRVRTRGKHDVLVPGEPGYEDADESAEFGLIRLRP